MLERTRGGQLDIVIVKWFIIMILYYSINLVTMVTGILSTVTKTCRLSLAFHAGSKSFRYRVPKSHRSLQLNRTAAVITIVAP